ncbi:hypothetical protein RSAG8_11236, partial [Rhizoctonia solani AG-8 WAC10335]
MGRIPVPGFPDIVVTTFSLPGKCAPVLLDRGPTNSTARRLPTRWLRRGK